MGLTWSIESSPPGKEQFHGSNVVHRVLTARLVEGLSWVQSWMTIKKRQH